MRIARIGMVVAGLVVIAGLMASPALAEEKKAQDSSTTCGSGLSSYNEDFYLSAGYFSLFYPEFIPNIGGVSTADSIPPCPPPCGCVTVKGIVEEYKETKRDEAHFTDKNIPAGGVKEGGRCGCSEGNCLCRGDKVTEVYDRKPGLVKACLSGPPKYKPSIQGRNRYKNYIDCDALKCASHEESCSWIRQDPYGPECECKRIGLVQIDEDRDGSVGGWWRFYWVIRPERLCIGVCPEK